MVLVSFPLLHLSNSHTFTVKRCVSERLPTLMLLGWRNNLIVLWPVLHSLRVCHENWPITCYHLKHTPLTHTQAQTQSCPLVIFSTTGLTPTLITPTRTHKTPTHYTDSLTWPHCWLIIRKLADKVDQTVQRFFQWFNNKTWTKLQQMLFSSLFASQAVCFPLSSSTIKPSDHWEQKETPKWEGIQDSIILI